MIVREARREDLTWIRRLMRQSARALACPEIGEVDPGIMAEQTALALEAESQWLLVIESDGRVVGVSWGSIEPGLFQRGSKIALQRLIWIDPEHRGAGAGKALLAAVESWARQHGATSVTGSSQPLPGSAEGTKQFYVKNGYRELETHYIRRL